MNVLNLIILSTDWVGTFPYWGMFLVGMLFDRLAGYLIKMFIKVLKKGKL